jgi:transcriptional regulator with XRE-family HTH domain
MCRFTIGQTFSPAMLPAVMSQPSPTDFNQRVGENLHQIRKAAGLSQADLAERLTARGLSFQQPTILKLEKGSRPLRLEEASAIAEELGVNVAALLQSNRDVIQQTLLARRQHCKQLQVELNELNQQVTQKTQALAEAWSLMLETKRELERVSG